MAYVVQRFLLFCFFVLFSEAADTLLQGEALADGETLISQNQIFELGFFTPSGENSSRARYLGIWYHGLPSMTVVWVANRNQPFSGAGGKLTFSADGNLVILSGAGDSIQITNSPSAASNSSLYLSHAGNLFLNSSSRNQVLWQSFDHPTDTFLPGMKLTLDLSTRESLLLRSWKSIGDPGEGNFSLGLDPRGSAQVYIWNGEKPRWRSGEWNRRIFIGISIRPLGLYGFNLYTEEGKMSLTFSEYNGSIFRFVIQPEGRLQVLQMVSGSKIWNTAFALPGNDCEIYNWCGDNARCVISAGGAAACECVTGFVPAAGGCVRRKELGCGLNGGERDEYAEVRGINLPDFSRWERNSTDGESCAEACSGNCSCAAYAFVNQIGCLLWGTPLVDMHQLSAGGYDLYLKLAASELPAGAGDSTWAIVLAVSLLAVAAFVFSLYLWWCQRTWIKGCWKKMVKREIREGRSEPATMSSTLFIAESPSGKSTELPLFSFDCISKATGEFAESNKLGEGGFGIVYKAALPDGREVAVKRLSEKSGQGIEEFKNEVRLIAKLQHRNLVRLLGCCVEAEEKILIYEYLRNKSLDAFIFHPEMGVQLDWRKRFSIIEGIARGLLYLHRDSRLRIIHRDLKASNILLDEEMNPKISDFGMARIFGGNQNQANTNRVVGTFGYMSPEYAMEGLFSIKSDVYSFGVLMLEIISGQRNNTLRQENTPNLVGRSWHLWNEDKSSELVDPTIKNSVSVREVARCVQVGLLCVQDRAYERPTMTSVVFMLGSDAIIQPVPKPPTFTMDGSTGEMDSTPHEFCESFSSRDITVSVVTGR